MLQLEEEALKGYVPISEAIRRCKLRGVTVPPDNLAEKIKIGLFRAVQKANDSEELFLSEAQIPRIIFYYSHAKNSESHGSVNGPKKEDKQSTSLMSSKGLIYENHLTSPQAAKACNERGLDVKWWDLAIKIRKKEIPGVQREFASGRSLIPKSSLDSIISYYSGKREEKEKLSREYLTLTQIIAICQEKGINLKKDQINKRIRKIKIDFTRSSINPKGAKLIPISKAQEIVSHFLSSHEKDKKIMDNYISSNGLAKELAAQGMVVRMQQLKYYIKNKSENPVKIYCPHETWMMQKSQIQKVYSYYYHKSRRSEYASLEEVLKRCEERGVKINLQTIKSYADRGRLEGAFRDKEDPQKARKIPRSKLTNVVDYLCRLKEAGNSTEKKFLTIEQIVNEGERSGIQINPSTLKLMISKKRIPGAFINSYLNGRKWFIPKSNLPKLIDYFSKLDMIKQGKLHYLNKMRDDLHISIQSLRKAVKVLDIKAEKFGNYNIISSHDYSNLSSYFSQIRRIIDNSISTHYIGKKWGVPYGRICGFIKQEEIPAEKIGKEYYISREKFEKQGEFWRKVCIKH
jgi:hypothetical protein